MSSLCEAIINTQIAKYSVLNFEIKYFSQTRINDS